jgi:hypothetical protein
MYSRMGLELTKFLITQDRVHEPKSHTRQEMKFKCFGLGVAMCLKFGLYVGYLLNEQLITHA